MYRPPAFREDDTDKLVAFMQAHSFATLVSSVNGQIRASHIPLVTTVIDHSLTLTGHLARQNPQALTLETGEALAIFTGPHAYISPKHYEQQENVPTWNYIAVHAYGVPRVITLQQAPDKMAAMIDDMTNTYEASFQQQWHSLSESYRVGMMNGIIGFEMPVTRLEGKYKLSQNRSETDRRNVAQALKSSPDPHSQIVGRIMEQSLEVDE
ncbi:MAG: FMN-binding negative transcriptional regulator [Leptolyngbyaceae cyanobacterium]